MDGKVQLMHNPILFGNTHISDDDIIDYDDTIRPSYSRQEFDKLIKQAENAEIPVSAYGSIAEKDLRDAFASFPVKDKSVLIVGTLVPWIEVICYVLGAKDIYT